MKRHRDAAAAVDHAVLGHNGEQRHSNEKNRKRAAPSASSGSTSSSPSLKSSSHPPSASHADPPHRPSKKHRVAATTSSDAALAKPPVKPSRNVLRNSFVPLSSSAGLSLAFSPADDASSDSVAAEFFQWLIAPLSTASFYANFFEKRPFALLRSAAAKNGRVQLVHTTATLPAMLKARIAAAASPSTVPTPSPAASANSGKVEQREEDIAVDVGSSVPSSPPLHHYSKWFSKADVLALAASPTHSLHYGTDVDVTQYTKGHRVTLNPPNSPRVTLSSIESFLARGCSIRFLSPQQHHPPLQRALHLLDQALGMQTGVNSYLTPKGTQGFSPHYDDVDVFIVQTEGSKRWRLYEPLEEAHLLPAVSSRNFQQHELGRCVLDVWLKAGDFLYAPRGTVHQCVASDTEDSLHVTLSSCLKSSWGDFLALLLQKAVERAKASDAAFRRCLPRQYHRYMGAQHEDGGDDERREAFMDQTLRMIERLVTMEGDAELPIDAAADEMALDYMHGRIKPYLLPAQQARSRAANAAFTLRPSTLVRTLEATSMRLTPAPEEGSVRIHHIADNALAYKGAPLGSVDVDAALGRAVETLIHSYPGWVRVGDLAALVDDGDEEESAAEEEDEDEQIRHEKEAVHLCQALYDSGLLEATDAEISAEDDDHKENEDAEDEDDDQEPNGRGEEKGSSPSEVPVNSDTRSSSRRRKRE